MGPAVPNIVEIMSLHLEYLPCDKSAPRRARTWVAERLRDDSPLLGGDSEFEYDVVLCTSEIVTGALLAGCSGLIVRLLLDDQCMRVSIVDDTPVPADRTAARFQAQWQGLRIVEALANRWGIDTATPGREVWAEFLFDNAHITD
jgi:hypothetical protein